MQINHSTQDIWLHDKLNQKHQIPKIPFKSSGYISFSCEESEKQTHILHPNPRPPRGLEDFVTTFQRADLSKQQKDGKGGEKSNKSFSPGN